MLINELQLIRFHLRHMRCLALAPYSSLHQLRISYITLVTPAYRYLLGALLVQLCLLNKGCISLYEHDQDKLMAAAALAFYAYSAVWCSLLPQPYTCYAA